MKHRIRRAIISASAVAAMAAAVVLTAPAGPAQAEGGGCRRWSNAYFTFDACIGDNGVRVAGDVYVKSFSTRGGDCGLELQVIEKETGRGVTYPSYVCKLGRIGPVRYPMRRGYHYYTHVVMLDGAGHGLIGYSHESYVP